jgi:hemoglobin
VADHAQRNRRRRGRDAGVRRMAGRSRTHDVAGEIGTVMSLYERLGQTVGIRAAVDEFYRRVLADPQLAPYFEGVDLAALHGHQTDLLVQVTGGPAGYTGRDLAESHRGRDITPEAFDRVVAHLVATLTELGVSQEDIGAVGEALTAHRGDIVATGTAA